MIKNITSTQHHHQKKNDLYYYQHNNRLIAANITSFVQESTVEWHISQKSTLEKRQRKSYLFVLLPPH